jgi:hypothetical protein
MWGTAASQRTEVQADGEIVIHRVFSGLPNSGGRWLICDIPELTKGRTLALAHLELNILNGAGQ